MIDPFDLTRPWDTRRLQEWFLFGICVAGKSAKQTREKLNNFLYGSRLPYDRAPNRRRYPFEIINYLIQHGRLEDWLRKHKMGQYDRISKAFRGLILTNPRTATLEELEAIHGVGPKTARMLLLYTRPGLEVIPLDTHILKWLKANGYAAPKSTPPAGPKYRELELAFIAEGKKRGLSPKDWDTAVWKMYARG